MHEGPGTEVNPLMSDRTGLLLLMTGPMFAGKSSALIAHAASQGDDVLVLKPAFDVRSGSDLVSSRDGTTMRALSISEWPAGAERANALVIDEVQFMVGPHYRGDIVDDVLDAVQHGQRVTVGGLDTDYMQCPFEVVTRLAEHADRHIRMSGRCHVCQAPASWTAKLHETGQRLELGCEDLYEARCDLHWSAPGAPVMRRPSLTASIASLTIADRT
jgi:thymidine kinase